MEKVLKYLFENYHMLLLLIFLLYEIILSCFIINIYKLVEVQHSKAPTPAIGILKHLYFSSALAIHIFSICSTSRFVFSVSIPVR